MLFVKIMSGENMPDTDPQKDYMIIQVGDRDRIQFGYPDKSDARGDLSLDNQNSVFIIRHNEPGFETYPLTGNCYVMNNSGKTIDTRGVKY